MRSGIVLPESFLRCLAPADRKLLGSGGLTAEEAIEKQVVRSEKELQRQIVGLLRLKGIEPNVSRMDKRKTDAVGWPDLTFAVGRGNPLFDTYEVFACAWEVKLHGELSHGQKQMAARLQTPPNGWTWREIRSVDAALAELRNMGIN